MRIIFTIFLLTALSAATMAKDNKKSKSKKEQTTIHAVTDLSHEFSFYADHRFHRQYLPDQKGETNWCSLFNFDFSNANLLILLGCDDQISYLPQDVETIETFLKAGGGVVILGNHSGKSQNALANVFGASFQDKATQPFKAVNPSAGVPESITAHGGSFLSLDKPAQWTTWVADAGGRPVMASRKVGKGTLVVGSRSVAGSNPNASDSINHELWRTLLPIAAAGKQVDPAKPFNSKGIENLEYREDHGTFILRYNDYMKAYANDMVDISKRCMPMIEKRMGVPLSKGMGSEIALLATGGGGFSSGKVIALAVWWGGFPEKEDSMIEFITHESVHSWVHPYPEIWNEPIATYVGDLVMMDMGHPEEAMRRINSTISQARKWDPEMKIYGIDGTALNGAGEKLKDGQLRDIHWGKTFWVFEELRKEYPDIVSRYFKAKRKLAVAGKLKSYDVNNTVAVMSAAVEKDLFPWFREHGFDVAREKAEIQF